MAGVYGTLGPRISTDLNNSGYPIGCQFGTYGEPSYGTATPKVYQALSTRNGGEVISADGY